MKKSLLILAFISFATCAFTELFAAPAVCSRNNSIWLLTPGKDKTKNIFIRQQGEKWKPVAINSSIKAYAIVAMEGGLGLVFNDNESVIMQKNGTRFIGPKFPGTLITACNADNFEGQNRPGLIVAVQKSKSPAIKIIPESKADKNKPNSDSKRNTTAKDKPAKSPIAKSNDKSSQDNALDSSHLKDDGQLYTYYLKNQTWKLLVTEPAKDFIDVQYACINNKCYRIVCKKKRPTVFELQRFSEKESKFIPVFAEIKKANSKVSEKVTFPKVELVPNIKSNCTLLAINNKLFFILPKFTSGQFASKAAEGEIIFQAQVFDINKKQIVDNFTYKPADEKTKWKLNSFPTINAFKKPGEQSIAFTWHEKKGYKFLLFSEAGKVLSKENITKEINSLPDPGHLEDIIDFILFGAIGLVTLLIFTGPQDAPKFTILPEGFIPGSLFKRAFAFLIDNIPYNFIFLYLLVPNLTDISPERASQLLTDFKTSATQVNELRLIFVAGLTVYWVIYGTISEWLFKTTIGKRIFGLKITGNAGLPLSLRSALIRNTMKPIELIMITMPGSIIMTIIGIFILSAPILSPINQRMGDKMAQTVVFDVKKSDPTKMVPDFIMKMVEEEASKANSENKKSESNNKPSDSDNDFYA